MWTTQTPGTPRTTMQVAMSEARSRKFAGMVSSLKRLGEAIVEAVRMVGKAMAQIGRAFQQIGELFSQVGTRPHPGAITFERRGRGLPSSPLYARSR